ncbi:magnesium transporter MRS2-4-like protein isoform X1 [Cinnamomum micranthum f. kanehirae]|uniref:Magnesium transporter MRS2-4-like protein isoform X1 n=1 Tax=Cinnamomum micranthum f. kanehirae TaxID=337451 RepID=A0A3S3N114_9MAGN|nr:magnesium transporter MRS2-4-like protein isoform X1 [Cinnamomum micranthum f. kanehirae]
MQFDSIDRSELFKCNKSTIINRVSIPARDFRILGPVFSPPSGITRHSYGRRSSSVLLLDPHCQEVLLFVNQLRTQLPLRNPGTTLEPGVTDMEAKGKRSLIGQSLPVSEDVECLQSELPFEFHVLEIALEVVCSYLNSSVVNLEISAYPALDELAKRVSTKNLECVLSLKGSLTHLLASVQKVKDEIEHLLDDSEDMAQLYLTRKIIQNQQYKALEAGASNSAITFPYKPPTTWF